MEQFAWILWIVLGVILIIAEILTLGFVLFWFGIGALAAAFAGFLGFGVSFAVSGFRRRFDCFDRAFADDFRQIFFARRRGKI